MHSFGAPCPGLTRMRDEVDCGERLVWTIRYGEVLDWSLKGCGTAERLEALRLVGGLDD